MKCILNSQAMQKQAAFGPRATGLLPLLYTVHLLRSGVLQHLSQTFLYWVRKDIGKREWNRFFFGCYMTKRVVAAQAPQIVLQQYAVV